MRSLNIGVSRDVWAEVCTESAGLPGLAFHRLVDMNGMVPDVVICDSRGLERDEYYAVTAFHQGFKLQLFTVSRHYSAGESNALKPTLQSASYSGCILPSGISEPYDLRFWLRQLSSLSFFYPGEPGSDFDLFGSLVTSGIHNIDEFWQLLAKQSRQTLENAKEKGKIQKRERIPHPCIEPSAQSKRFSELYNEALRILEELESHISGHVILKNRIVGLKADFASRNNWIGDILIVGAFSSGKTTFLNHVLLPDTIPPLPTEPGPNTAMTFTLRLDSTVDRPTMIRRVAPVSEHVLMQGMDKIHCLSILGGQDKSDYEDINAVINGLSRQDLIAYYYPFGTEILMRIGRGRRLGWEDPPPGIRVSPELIVKFRFRKQRDEYWSMSKKSISLSTLQELNNLLVTQPLFPDVKERPSFEVRQTRKYGRGDQAIDNVTLLLKTSVESNPQIIDLTGEDVGRHLQAKAISWLGAEVEYLLPITHEFEWLGQARIVDTPGVYSPNAEHDQLTRIRLMRVRDGDIIVVLLRIRGNERSEDGAHKEFLKEILESTRRKTIVIIANWMSRNIVLTKEVSNKYKADLATWVSDIVKKYPIEERPNVKVQVMDVLSGDVAGQRQFAKEFCSMLGDKFLIRAADEIAARLAGVITEIETDLGNLKLESQNHNRLKHRKSIAESLLNTGAHRFQMTLTQSILDLELGPVREWRSKVLGKHFDIKNNGAEQFISVSDKFMSICSNNLLWTIGEEQPTIQKRHAKISARLSHGLKDVLKGMKLRASAEEAELSVREDWLAGLPLHAYEPFPNSDKALKARQPFKSIAQSLYKSLSRIQSDYEHAGRLKRSWNWLKSKIGMSSFYSQWDSAINDAKNSSERNEDILRQYLEAWIAMITDHVFQKTLPSWTHISRGNIEIGIDEYKSALSALGGIYKMFLNYNKEKC